jgi:F-type H+-transporting ATPase subunit epsilon
MATFHFDLVSPEKLLFSGEVDQVDVPGAEGDFGVLAEHAPFVSVLRPGILTIYNGGEARRVVVFGGFAEVSPSGLTILADQAMPVDEVNPALIAGAIKDTEEDLADTSDDRLRDKLRHRLDQLRGVQAAVGSGGVAAH